MAARDLDLTEKPASAAGAWQALARKALGLAADAALVSSSADGLAVPMLGARANWPDADASGIPGASPFTRGTRSETNGRWDIRALCAEPDTAKAKAEIHEALANGASSICLRIGAALPAAGEWERLVSGIPPGVAIALDADAEAAAIGRLLLDAAADPKGAMLFVNHDAFSLAAKRGAAPSLTDAVSLGLHFAAASPRSRAIAVDTRAYHGAGATLVHELAIALASGAAYLRALTEAGLALSDAARQIAFILVTDADFVMSVAKLRAFRRLWARVLEACGVPDAMRDAHVTAVMSELMMTRRDTYTNVLRTTAATFAAAAGGADAIVVLPHTTRIGDAPAAANRLARNVQNILMEESHLARVIDPAGGAFAFERATEDLAAKAWGEFQEIEREGGMAAALSNGFIHARIAEAWEVRRKRIAQRSDLITGITDFPVLSGQEYIPPESSPLPVADARPIQPLPIHHLDEDFEKLRTASDRSLSTTGERPRVYLARIGTELNCAERAAFARALFEAGGIEAVLGEPTSDAENAGAAFLDSGIRVAALVSSDEEYERRALAFAHEIKRAGARYLYFVGRPGDLEEPLLDAGIDAFVDHGVDAVEMLERLHILLGLSP